MYHLTFEEMRQLFELIHGHLPAVDDCALAVDLNSCVLVADRFSIKISWGFVPGKISCTACRYVDEYDYEGDVVSITYDKAIQIVNQLVSWGFDVPYTIY